MTITIQDTDGLTIDLIKQHLYIDTTADDILLGAYKDASLEIVKRYTSSDILKTEWGSTTLENILINNLMFLDLQYQPYEVNIVSDVLVPDNILHKSYSTQVSTNMVNTVVVDKDFYSYINNQLVIDVSNIIEYNEAAVLTASVFTGNEVVSKNIDLARLLLIGGWYANRESSTNLASNKIPFNVELLLDLESNSVI